VRLSLGGGISAASLPMKSIGSKKTWVLAGNQYRLDKGFSIHTAPFHGRSYLNVAR
jgi:hypothetical protein